MIIIIPAFFMIIYPDLTGIFFMVIHFKSAVKSAGSMMNGGRLLFFDELKTPAFARVFSVLKVKARAINLLSPYVGK